MDVASEWFSIYENFHGWCTKPMNLVSEKLAVFLVSQDHPKQESREY